MGVLPPGPRRHEERLGPLPAPAREASNRVAEAVAPGEARGSGVVRGAPASAAA